ncbi:ankyrin repeat protein [Colletotrichum plurivorum]|uniref:Ankyrin repeat protein n=1 Tax=Colletotrichum plurivorum TaxID=2175906 RepID=A0A8H6N3Z7_9PEZI|nr:ankyrin repeat protein [Colletotrichum plurivorum]
MSQSTGWADCIMLAMAPIGVITVIVSAIRVGGYTWLKAVVGRARENIVAAELEVMSSTSKEACELWNGRNVVRCPGAADICEFICLYPTETKRKDITSARIMDIEKATSSNEDHAKDSSRFLLIRPKKRAPNISLNCQADGHRWPIWLCAAITVVLQAGALLYFGFVTEYHTLKFEKEGEPVQDYTMPLAVTGTVFLVLGMLLCGHVVNKAREETRWELNDGKHHAISMIWLQKRKQVSDQQFESKAIFPEKKRNQFVISARAIGEEETSLFRWLQILSFFGVFISLAGSVCQFTGLRGMHWTASIAQLGVVALATFVRAVVRRALTHDIKQQTLMPGYELDWFVMSLSNMQTAVWFPPENKSAWERFCSKVVSAFGWVSCKLEALFGQSDNGCQNTSQPAEKNEESCFWTIETGLPAFETRTGSIERTGDQKIRQYRQVDGIHTAQGILNLRRYLGELGNWKSPVFAEAVALSKAIEITMGYFEDHLKNPNTECFTWKMQVKVGYDKKAVLGYLGAYGRLRLSNARRVEFNVEKKADGWKARIDELDAALSLWLYSVHSSKGNRDEANRTAFPSGDDQWLRGKKVKEQCLHVIGPFSPRLVQDLEWWIPNGLEGIKTSGPPKRDEKVDKNSFPRDVWIERIGHAGLRSPKSSNGQFSKRLSNPMDGNITHWNWKPTESSDLSGGDTEEKPTDDHLIVESQNTLARLYATDMFTSFVWALAEQLEPLSVNQKVKATVQLGDTTGREAWKNFTLRSPWLSRLVQTIVELGSWTEREVYLSLTPHERFEQPSGTRRRR